jgi:hypothetical protein
VYSGSLNPVSEKAVIVASSILRVCVCVKNNVCVCVCMQKKNKKNAITPVVDETHEFKIQI